MTAIINECEIASAESIVLEWKHNGELNACVVSWSADGSETTLKQNVDLGHHQSDMDDFLYTAARLQVHVNS